MTNNISELVSSYFLGEKLTEEQLKQIHSYRIKCIERALNPNLTETFTSYSETFRDAFLHRFVELFKTELQDKPVIELGPGSFPFTETVTEFGAKKYIAVEPFVAKRTKLVLPEDERMHMVEKDGLSYLLTQPDESAIVVSFGVFAPELYGFSNFDEVENYYRFMAKEIRRVTPKNNISVHFSGTAETFLREFGFEQVPGNPRSCPMVFRKK